MSTNSVGEELNLALASKLVPLLTSRINSSGEKVLAELSFSNLWLFRRAHQWIFLDGEWPCITGIGYDGLKHAIPLFDLHSAPSFAIDDLLAKFGCLFPLSDSEILQYQYEKRFSLTFKEYDSDYVYPADQFRDYRGPILNKKKNLMAQFLRKYEITVTDYSAALQDLAIQVLENWMNEKGLVSGQADDQPCRDALAHSQHLGLKGFIYMADGNAAGFILAEELQMGVWVVRFAKGLSHYKGVSQYMFHHFSSIPDLSVNWFNFEQDLDLHNFRQTKQSYQPSMMLRKWRLELK